MPKEHLRTTYSQRIEQFKETIGKRTKLINYIVLGRLSSLVALVWLLVLGLRNQGFFYYGLSFLMVIVFLVLVSLHNNVLCHLERAMVSYCLLIRAKTLPEAYIRHILPDFNQ